MAQDTERTDNHNQNDSLIPSNRWGSECQIAPEEIEQRISALQNKIAPCKPKIIGVTKYYGLSSIINGYKAGLRDFGESRVKDAVEKINRLPLDIRQNSTFHFIGHLQTNKAEKAVEYFDYIHSVDSLKLAQVISESAKCLNKVMKVFLQVNNAEEEQKFGYSKQNLEADFEEIISLDNLVVVGLMNMAPLGASPQELIRLFRDLREYKNLIEERYLYKLPELSMGMSDDYEYAVKEGATMIRIGRKLFT